MPTAASNNEETTKTKKAAAAAAVKTTILTSQTKALNAKSPVEDGTIRQSCHKQKYDKLPIICREFSKPGQIFQKSVLDFCFFFLFESTQFKSA